jgi:predicted DNA-binding WGR domain protein
MKVHGVSLHYFDDRRNSDKFYRTFIWQDSHQTWHVAYHWGRDGAPRGQTKMESYSTKRGVEMALDKKVNEKISKGYEYLGQGDIDVSDRLFNSDFMRNHAELSVIGNQLHDRVGRTPTKLPSGFTLVIQEEDDIMDLINA